MKLKYFIFILFISVILGTSCKDDDDGNIFGINPVENLKAISGDNQITLSWTNPTDKSFAYIKITSANISTAETDTFTYKSNGKVDGEYSIGILTANEKDVYKFTIVAYNTSGDRSEARYVKGKAFSDDSEIYISEILKGISVDPIVNEGVKFTWENEHNVKCKLKVNYKIGEQQYSVNYDLLSIPSEGVINSGITLETTFVLQIIMDDGLTTSETRDVVVRPILYPKLNKSRWTIYSFSSQKAQSGNGSASCLIDGTNTTMWSADVYGPNQYVVVDLGGRVVLDKFSLERNFGDSNAAGWDLEYSIGDDPSNDVWSYVYSYFTSSTQGAFFQVEFSRTTEGEQLYQLPLLSKQITGRYVRIKVTRIANNSYIHFGEFNVYGTYIE